MLQRFVCIVCVNNVLTNVTGRSRILSCLGFSIRCVHACGSCAHVVPGVCVCVCVCVCVSLCMEIFDTKDTLSHAQKLKLTTRMHVHPGGDVLIDLDLLGNKRGGADAVDQNLDFSALVM